MYGSGTIATSGCSIVSLAMVASYLTDHEYTPDELAHYFGGRAINNIARLEYGNKTLQLACKKAANWHVVYKALQEGQVAIVLMNHNSIFTNSQHFIVLAGINENGKIIVNDSNRDNYDFWQLKKGFEEGFNPEDILLGYDGAWIYDKSAMPEEPFIYYEEEPERGEPRYARYYAESGRYQAPGEGRLGGSPGRVRRRPAGRRGGGAEPDRLRQLP